MSIKVFRVVLIFALLLGGSLTVASPVHAAGILYARPIATGTGDCSSWANACDLQTALSNASSGDEVWVAAGTHKPTSDTDRTISFELKNGVAVYGGFAGTETSRDQRDFQANLTVLSGDIGTIGDMSDNSYTVVISSGVDATAILDGFTITRGNANVDYAATGTGGGMYNYAGSPTVRNSIFINNKALIGGAVSNYSYSAPTFTDVIFSNNSADGGGGMSNYTSSAPILKRVVFDTNAAESGGGGMLNDIHSAPVLTDVVFRANTAVLAGGGIFNNGSAPKLERVLFVDNSATGSNAKGGAFYNYYYYDLQDNTIFKNVTFSGNTSNDVGGAIYIANTNPVVQGSPILTNVTFHNNSAVNQGGAIYVNQNRFHSSNQQVILQNLILWGNTASTGSQIHIVSTDLNPVTISDTIIQGGCPALADCANVSTSDPLLGTLGDYGGFTETIPLLAGSPAIDAGNDAFCPATDQRGVTRPQGAHCDMGAYEYYAGIYYVKPIATGTGDCSSWANACDLQTALSNASSGDEVWVAAGTHKPTTGTDQTAYFPLMSGVAVYGGFVGTEIARSQRDFETHLTILSGDLLGNDNANVAPDEPTRADNSYHVVAGGGMDSVLDGFTITAGNANGEYAFPCDQRCGGGMFSIGSPALANIIFRDNAAHDGGGMFNLAPSGTSSKPTLLDVTFSGNVAQGEWGQGGGMANFGTGGVSSPTLINVTFNGNAAQDGGGMHNISVGSGGESSPILNNVVFRGNTAQNGGGMHNFSGSGGASSPVLTDVTFNGNAAETGGGMYNYSRYDGESSPILTNVTIISNTAQSGAGMFNLGQDGGEASPSLMNVTFVGNTAGFDTGGMLNWGQGGVSSPVLTNVVFTGNMAQWVGGMSNMSTDGGESSPTLTNVTFSGNAALSGGSGSMQNTTFEGSTCSPVLVNVIMWGNTGTQINNPQNSVTPSISYSIIQGSGGSQNWDPSLGIDGGHNLDVDPQFIDPLPASAAPTIGGNYRLQAGSPAINAGNNAVVPGGATDLDGNPRIIGSAVDIGAYEYQQVYTGVYYVKPSATGVGNCQSWANACDLQTALTSASSGDEIWVAAGVHKPTTNPSDRAATFLLKNGVAVYGGFAGTETARSQRDFEANLTILSGDIDDNDSQKPIITNLSSVTGNTTNSHHVVTSVENPASTILDGFIITAGYAAGTFRDVGGGMLNLVGSSPTLVNLTFRGNYARQGGGMYNGSAGLPGVGSSPSLTNVAFIGNAATEGAGMYNYENSNPTLLNVTFSQNVATMHGGGMNNQASSPVLTNVTFSGNSALTGGGVENWSSSAPTLTNVTFSGNTASAGGGMSNVGNSNSQVRNVIFWGNSASTGAQIYNGNSIPIISHSVIQGGCPALADCANVSTSDPLLGSLGNYGGFTQTIPLLPGSPAIDAGSDAFCPATDQRGVTRPQGAHCDMGAYEAGNLIVTKLADTNDGICDNDCSLREAIQAISDGGTITFSPSLSGQTITLGATLVINRNLTIDGSTLASKISVSGSNSVGVFEIASGATVGLNSIIISNGRATERDGGGIMGGGITNFGNLTITHSAITNNIADQTLHGNGGGIHNLGQLTVTNSIIANNTAYYGGGIMNLGYLAQIMNSTISGNVAVEGAGILNNATTLELSDSTVSNNVGEHGGGILSINTLIVTNSTFSGNSSSDDGGGILSYGPVTVTNSTFSGNSAVSKGGGIYNGNGTLNLTNTIVANSTSGGDCYNDTALNGTMGTNVNTLVENNSPPPYNCGSPLITTDPMFGTLGNYGGFTRTIPLLPGSPAIDAGSDAFCPATDQRGVIRPQGAHCDIGAYELAIYTVTFDSAGGSSVPSQNVYHGGIIAQPADPTRSGYAFAGWNNGPTRWNFATDTVTADLTLTAQWTDPILPSVLSITRASANPTNASSVDFTVTFSEPVTGVDASDFSPTATGSVSGASVTGVSGGPTVYTVTVNTGIGSGTIRLDLNPSGTGIEDLEGNPIAGGFTDGEAYTLARGPIPNTWVGGIAIQSDQSIVAVARPHLGSQIASYISANTGSTTQYVPMLFKDAFSGGSYKSALYIQNLGNASASLTIEFINDSGATVHTITEPLAAKASKGYWLSGIAGIPTGFAGAAKVTADQPVLAVGRPHIGAEVMSYNGMSAGSTTAWLPMFFKNGFGNYNTALYVQNITSSSADLTIEYLNLDGTVACQKADSLAANASKGYWSLTATCDTGSLPMGFVGGVKVTSTENILAVGRAHLGIQITTYNGFAGGAPTAYVPMLFKNAFASGSYKAALYLQNVSGASADVTIEYVNDAGAVAATQNVTLASGAISSIWLPGVAGLPDGFVGGARITADQDIVAVGRPHLGTEITAYNGAPLGSTSAYLPMLFKNAFAAPYNAAFYVQNVTGNTATVDISFYDDAGTLSCIKAISLAPNATQGFWMPTVSCAP